MRGPSGFWCRGCGKYLDTRTASAVRVAKAHTQAHIDKDEPTKDGGPWIKS